MVGAMSGQGACGGPDDFSTVHRTSGSLKQRPATIPESTHPKRTYGKVLTHE